MGREASTMITVKSNYDKYGKLQYTTIPYEIAELFDEDDDDLCVWKHTDDSDDDRLFKPKSHSKGKSSSITKHPIAQSSSSIPKGAPSSSNINSIAGQHTGDGADRDSTNSLRRSKAPPQPHDKDVIQLGQKALESTVRNLTRLSQHMLKLEVRAGKTTKEAIRQTLDDTADETTVDRLTQEELVERISRLSEETSRRMALIDKHFRRQCSRTPSDQPISLLRESSVKSWWNVETTNNHISSQDPCYFTVKNLSDGRTFRDWLGYLRGSCGFKSTDADDQKLLNLAWRFLDRDLRGGVPPPSLSLEAWLSDLEHKHKKGQFQVALENTEKQLEVDDDSWQNIRKVWSARAKNQ